MNKLKSFWFLFLMIPTLFVQAQEVTDYDLERFAKAYSEMVTLNLNAQHEMAKIIADVELDLETYHAINDTKDNPDIVPDVADSEFEKFERIQPEIQKVQEKLEADVEKAYAKQDLTKRDYTAIAERVKQDQMLQMKLEAILGSLR
ncbi:MAG: DUF4168 domain-containing protein [Moheibacter sp.]